MGTPKLNLNPTQNPEYESESWSLNLNLHPESKPPRPLASRHVHALTKQQTLQTLPNPKQAHKGEDLPSPYRLSTGPARSVRASFRLLVTLVTP